MKTTPETGSTMPTLRREGVSRFANPQREAVRRLRLLSLIASVAPAVSLTLMLILSPDGSPIREATGITVTAILGIITTSIAVNRLLGSEALGIGLRLDIGFGYEIVVALLLATMRHTLPWIPGDGYREISPVALVIVLFAALVPNPPRRTFFVSIAAALMEPVGLAINIARGNPTPSYAQILVICAGPLMAAMAATLVSRVVHGLAQSADAARRMGSYKLVTRIGKGGMGEVWRAEHDLLARPAAIKLIRSSEEQGPMEIARFEREAQATAALRSPHTIQLYDFGVAEGGTFYYVMELLDGLDLERMVADTGPVSPERAVPILSQICRSLDEAHHSGLVHRDIKPANILVCSYGRELDFVKVLDFGLVKPAGDKGQPESGEAKVTRANTVLGTPAYMAPEMILSGVVDERADIYAVGCVAYWMLTGRLVFEGDSVVKLAVAHVHETPDAPSKHAEGVPAELDAVVLACLEKDPARRPQKIAEVGRLLRAVPLRAAWTQEDAEAWWKEHRVVAKAELETAPTVRADGA